MRRTTELDKKIGKRILELRLAKGLSRDSVAEAVGVTHQQFSKYESGVNRLSVVRLLAIAKILETEPSYFYSEHQDSEHCVGNSLDKPREEKLNQRARMNLELARNLQNIDNEEIQTSFLQLTKKIADHLKTNKETKNDN